MGGEMNVPVLLVAFTVSTVHSLLPSHWLCFVLVGRARGWSLRRTLAVTAGAGLCHVGSTILLGVGAMLLAREFIDESMLPQISGAVLIGVGVLYLVLHVLHVGHRHEEDAKVADRVAVASLFVMLFFQPCEAVIPLFPVAAGAPMVIALMCVIVTATTVGMMMVLVGLGYAGAQAARLEVSGRYEKLIIGGVLAGLGGVVLALG